MKMSIKKRVEKIENEMRTNLSKLKLNSTSIAMDNEPCDEKKRERKKMVKMVALRESGGVLQQRC